MQDVNDDHPPIWHWNPSYGRRGEVGLPLNLYSETWASLEFMPEKSVGMNEIYNTIDFKYQKLPEGFEPECFFYDAILKQKRESRPDFDQVKGAALYASHKMIDLLQEFDLGDSTILELPLFDGKERGEGKYPFQIVGPNYDLPFPDRGGLFHLVARKMSFLPEKSENLTGAGMTKSGVRTFSRNDYEIPLVLALDAKTASAGADIWIEAQFRRHIFCSNRLMQAMKAEGIDNPMVAFSEAAALV